MTHWPRVKGTLHLQRAHQLPEFAIYHCAKCGAEAIRYDGKVDPCKKCAEWYQNSEYGAIG